MHPFRPISDTIDKEKTSTDIDSFIIHHLLSHGKCVPEDNGVVIELQRVAGLNSSTRMPHIRDTTRRRVQIHPAS